MIAASTRIGLALVVLTGITDTAIGQRSSALDAAARVMGGRERILATRVLVAYGSGEGLVLGQNHTPYAKTNFTMTSFRRSYDFATGRWHLEQMRELRYLTPVPAPLQIGIGFDGQTGYNAIGGAAASPTSAEATSERAKELIYHPIGFLQAAYSPGNAVTERVSGAGREIEVRVGPNTYTMLVDARTHLPTRITHGIAHPVLGDVNVQVELSDWRTTGGQMLPMHLVHRIDRWLVYDFRIDSVHTNPEPGRLVATPNVSTPTRGETAGDSVPAVTVDEVAPGVWILGGSIEQTIAIEQSGRIVLIEAPESDRRTLAAIAKARELRPGKPLGPLVNTHHHFDHAGGVRAAISAGLTIITHDGNRELFERVIYPNRHTRRPDALAMNPQPLSLRTVRDTLTLADPVRPIVLYAVDGSPHSGTILMAYLPTERILVQADLDQPRARDGDMQASPFTPSLIEAVRRRRLDVERVVGLHGPPVPWS